MEEFGFLTIEVTGDHADGIGSTVTGTASPSGGTCEIISFENPSG